MKKSLVALAVLAASAAATAAPQQDTFYAGAKAGWASFHHGVNQLDSKYANDSRYTNAVVSNNRQGYGINRNSVTYGVFGGYQILNVDNFGLAAELGYDYYGRLRGNFGDERAFKHSAHGLNFSLKPSYEVVRDLDVYGKVGVAAVRNDYKFYEAGNQVEAKTHKYKASLLLGAGVEYAILPELAARIEYQWLSKAGNYNKSVLRAGGRDTHVNYSPDIHSVSAGLTYRFGQGAAPAPVAAPEVVSKNFAFSSDVLFAFGKSNLKPAAAQALDAMQSEINASGLGNAAIQVNGYTDRIGKEAANLKLSQRRAETVANYIVSKGTPAANVTAVGYGAANPVTGNTCDAVKGRKALIACLAPDRRVEVQVQGSKEVTM